MGVGALPINTLSVSLIEHTADLHLKNILVHSPSIASWSSEEDVYTYLGPPDRCDVFLTGAEEPAPFSPHVPAYIVMTPDPTSLLKLCLSHPSQVNIKICDFSESFIYSPGIKRKLHTPAVYAAPEILLDDDPSPASDVWAFAVLVYFLVSGGCYLFPSYRSIPNEVLSSMVQSLGKFAEHLWLKWAERGQYLDESGQWVAGPKRKPIFGGCSGRMNEQQIIPFESMIRKMVAYEPRERATMAEVVDGLIPDTWSLVDAGDVGTKVDSEPIQIV